MKIIFPFFINKQKNSKKISKTFLEKFWVFFLSIFLANFVHKTGKEFTDTENVIRIEEIWVS